MRRFVSVRISLLAFFVLAIGEVSPLFASEIVTHRQRQPAQISSAGLAQICAKEYLDQGSGFRAMVLRGNTNGAYDPTLVFRKIRLYPHPLNLKSLPVLSIDQSAKGSSSVTSYFLIENRIYKLERTYPDRSHPTRFNLMLGMKDPICYAASFAFQNYQENDLHLISRKCPAGLPRTSAESKNFGNPSVASEVTDANEIKRVTDELTKRLEDEFYWDIKSLQLCRQYPPYDRMGQEQCESFIDNLKTSSAQRHHLVFSQCEHIHGLQEVVARYRAELNTDSNLALPKARKKLKKKKVGSP